MASQLALKEQLLLRKWNFYTPSRAGIQCMSCIEAGARGRGVNVTNPAESYRAMADHAKKAHGFTNFKGEATIVGRELQKQVDVLRAATHVHTMIEQGIEGWKCGDCPAVFAYERDMKRHYVRRPGCDMAKTTRIALYRTATRIMTDDEVCEELRKTNHDKVYRAVQARRDDFAWVQRHPEDLRPLLLPSDFSGVEFKQTRPVASRVMCKKRGNGELEVEKELFESISDLRNVTEEESEELLKRVDLIAAAQRKPGAYFDGARYRKIFEGCEYLDVREETADRIRLEVTIPDPREEDPTKTIQTNVFVFDLSQDRYTMSMLRQIGERLHKLRGKKGTVRQRRKDTGPMLGIGHRYHNGRLVLYAPSRDKAIQEMMKIVNKRVAMQFRLRAREYYNEFGKHGAEFGFPENLIGGTLGMGLSVMVSENYSNSAHKDPADGSMSGTIFVDGKHCPPLKNRFFLFPSLSLNNSKGVAITLFHGCVVVWDGQLLRHCTSVAVKDDGKVPYNSKVPTAMDESTPAVAELVRNAALREEERHDEARKDGVQAKVNEMFFGFGFVLCRNNLMPEQAEAYGAKAYGAEAYGTTKRARTESKQK
jgi:hypothetical protein